jgi:hypothetical protein
MSGEKGMSNKNTEAAKVETKSVYFLPTISYMWPMNKVAIIFAMILKKRILLVTLPKFSEGTS